MNMETGELDRSQPPLIKRSVINSCAKWNYSLVQDILDGKVKSEADLDPEMKPVGFKFEELAEDCRLMNEIAQKRRDTRLASGSLMLSNREFIFLLEEGSLLPTEYKETHPMLSKQLVEEFMLMANILIAEFLYENVQDKTVLRAHPDVDAEKKEELKHYYKTVGLDVDVTNSTTLSTSLEKLRLSNPEKYQVAHRKFLSCLKPAVYMCVNDYPAESYHHYGLNFALYTHFTSPIRRYADVLVHRLVTLSLRHGKKARALIEGMDYSSYATLCSEKCLAAKKASTQCQRVKSNVLFLIAISLLAP